MNTVEIKSLHVYPVKSCGGIDLNTAEITQRGFVYDRNWMIIRPDGSKITQRDNSLLASIKTNLTDDHLILSEPSGSKLEISLRELPVEKISAEIWDDNVIALNEGHQAASWLSDILKEEVLLVRFDPSQVRSVAEKWAGTSGAHTAFSDVLPFLVTSVESLEALNEFRRNEGLSDTSMKNFRPNIVIEGAGRFGEDEIEALALPDTGKIELVRPCDRCPIINIDQERGEKEKIGNLQILGDKRLLANYKGKKGVMFGVQGFPINADGKKISVGNKLEIAANSEGLNLPPMPRLS